MASAEFNRRRKNFSLGEFLASLFRWNGYCNQRLQVQRCQSPILRDTWCYSSGFVGEQVCRHHPSEIQENRREKRMSSERGEDRLLSSEEILLIRGWQRSESNIACNESSQWGRPFQVFSFKNNVGRGNTFKLGYIAPSVNAEGHGIISKK